MKVAHYWPNRFMARWTEYCPGVEFMNQSCDASCDLIYAGSISVLDRGIAAKRKFSKPLVCWVWDIPFNWRDWCPGLGRKDCLRDNVGRDDINANRVSLLKECDLVISASKFTQATLKDLGIASEQIYFYIDTDELEWIPAGEKKRQAIQVSRYFWNKRFEDSIRAASLAGCELVCIGSKQSQVYFDYLKSCGAVPRTGVSREETIREIKSSAVLVSPSIFEGWGITPIEAIYCGVPILLADIPVFREVWGDGALYHRQRDFEDMAEKLRQLLGDEDLQKKIVKDCRPRIAEFTPEKFARRWKALVN